MGSLLYRIHIVFLISKKGLKVGGGGGMRGIGVTYNRNFTICNRQISVKFGQNIHLAMRNKITSVFCFI